MQTSTLVASLTACVGVLGASAWYLLRDAPTPIPRADVPPGPQAVATSTDVNPIGHMINMGKPFPFDTFQKEIDELREVRPNKGEPSWKDKEHEHNKLIVEHKIAVQFEDASLQEVVDFLRLEYAKIGITITGLDQPLPEGFKVTMFRAETDAFQVIAEIQKATEMFVVYAFSEYGVCIGTERTIQEWQIQSKSRRARENAEREHGAKILDGKFTVDVKGAHIGAVTQKMTADTAGEWKFTIKSWMDPEAEPMLSEGTAHRTMELGGRVVEEVVESSMMGQPFEGIGRTGYDNLTGEWWSTWTDNMSTGLMTMTGTYDEAPRRYSSRSIGRVTST
jgi:hypothetical protein